MVCLPFEFSFSIQETAVDSRAYTPIMHANRSPNQTQFRCQPRSRMATAECQRWATIRFRLLAAGTSTLWISTNVAKDADSDCSRTIAETLLLFTFTKKALIFVNFDVDVSHLFTHSRLAGAILNSLYDIRVTGLFLEMRAQMEKGHRNAFPNK